MVSFALRPHYSSGGASITHRIGCWVDPRGGLEVLKERKVLISAGNRILFPPSSSTSSSLITLFLSKFPCNICSCDSTSQALKSSRQKTTLIACEDGVCFVRQNYKAHRTLLLRWKQTCDFSLPPASSGIIIQVWGKKGPYHTRIKGLK